MSESRTIPTPDLELTQDRVGQAVPHPPSFIDRFTDFIQSLPIPYGLTYLLLFILESGIILILSWIDGWLPAFEFDPIVLTFPLWIWGLLAIITYLDSLSLQALSEFGPLLDIPTETMHRMEYEFTTMPVRGVLLSSFAWMGFFLLSWYLAFQPAVISAYGYGAVSNTAFLSWHSYRSVWAV